MLERVHVGSYSHYVDSYSLCVGFRSNYEGCYRRREGCYNLYVCFKVAMWAAVASLWYVTGAIGVVVNARWNAQALFRLLQPLCRLLQALYGLLHHLCGLYSHYVGC